MALSVMMKCYLEMSDLSIETRCFRFDPKTTNDDGVFKAIQSKVGTAFPDLKDKSFTLFWKDEDEDFITVSTDEEMQNIISNEANGTCKIYAKVNEDKFNETTNSNGLQSANDEEFKETSNGDERYSDYGPPHRFHFHGRGGIWGSRAMGHHPFRVGPWGRERGFRSFNDFPGHHHPFYHGGHHGFGLGGPPHSHRGHRHGNPCHGQRPHGHGHGGPHHHGHGGKHGWRDSLTNAVPMPHRRWAKAFIQNWRKENLKNATSTSDSDCTSDKQVTMANAGIPPVYADWLRMKLFRWHKKWGIVDMDEIDGENMTKEYMKKAKKTLKGSVSHEFRKWIKWYLHSHFAIREAPKFRRHCDSSEINFQKMDKKIFINSRVPKEYRIWTMFFIKNWRIEKKIDAPNTEMPPFSYDEDQDKTSDMEISESVTVPKEYDQWLELFLLRWHTWRGQLERNLEVPLKGGMAPFKDTVPMAFRTWVKHYLCMHYNKQKMSKCVIEAGQREANFQKRLQAFQRQWLQDKQCFNTESTSQSDFSDSDEDTLAEKDGSGKIDIPFEKLNLNSMDGNEQKRQVHFDEEKGGLAPKRKGAMTPEFRQWTKQALCEWDGVKVNNWQQEGEEDDFEHLLTQREYKWMSNLMNKIQLKNMKQQLKAAKREAKAARKQH